MPATGSACSPDRVTAGEVHAWLVDLDAPPDGFDTALALAERERADNYISASDGARFAAGRAWLRVILGRYLSAEQARLVFGTSSRGRPALTGEHAGLIHFSLSRSGDRGLVAVSGSPVGADIELVRARAGLADLAAARFGAAETRCIAAGCGGSWQHSFYRHWTAKEAFLKLTGRGLAGLRTTELACGARPAILVGGQPASLTLSLLDAGQDCAAAIVGSGPATACVVRSQ